MKTIALLTDFGLADNFVVKRIRDTLYNFPKVNKLQIKNKGVKHKRDQTSTFTKLRTGCLAVCGKWDVPPFLNGFSSKSRDFADPDTLGEAGP